MTASTGAATFSTGPRDRPPSTSKQSGNGGPMRSSISSTQPSGPRTNPRPVRSSTDWASSIASPRTVFDRLLRYAVTEDGALHAEKYYRTVSEEFAATRPAFRWRQLVALARVTASEYGRPAPGVGEASERLGIG